MWGLQGHHWSDALLLQVIESGPCLVVIQGHVLAEVQRLVESSHANMLNPCKQDSNRQLKPDSFIDITCSVPCAHLQSIHKCLAAKHLTSLLQAVALHGGI